MCHRKRRPYRRWASAVIRASVSLTTLPARTFHLPVRFARPYTLRDARDVLDRPGFGLRKFLNNHDNGPR